jgi:hypothetical protein
MSGKRVIVLIVAFRTEISPLEEISLKQCFKVLGRHPIRLVCPEGTDLEAYRRVVNNLEVDFINHKWHKSYSAANRLRLEPFVYKRYRDYDFILFYDLDAFVFRDELEQWCDKDYDYIGAPWFEDFRGSRDNSAIIGVGNGGFSLRKTRSLLKALHRFSWIINPADWFRHDFPHNKLKALGALLKNSTIGNNSFFLFNDYPGQEDIFWGLCIKRNFEWFKVASIEEAARFSFELQPRTLYAMNERRLPFGCHAWWRYDFEFWKPFIESEGYSLPRVAEPVPSVRFSNREIEFHDRLFESLRRDNGLETRSVLGGRS